MNWIVAQFEFDATDRFLQKTPFSFDASIWEFYAPLWIGGRLILARPDGHRDGNYLVETIIEQDITILQLVPSQLQMLLQVERFAQCRSLRIVFCGGEPLTPQLVNQFWERLPNTRLVNLYGPSEATIDSTFWESKKNATSDNIPIGKPIANAQVYLLDNYRQPVPVGVAGEIYIGGAGVGQGYHNRPELTAKHFVDNPFSKESESCLYKTGDLGRFLPDGNIQFLGRVDHQVKIHGFRIELGEIETALHQHPAVREAIVLAREDSPGDKRLAAYVVLTQATPPTVGEWRHFLSQTLPNYMVPSAFVVLNEIPLNPSGKVDRKALPVPELDRSALGSNLVAPGTATEETLANIWREVLKLKTIGINDNFFELGGDSIATIQVAMQISRTFQIELQPVVLFEIPTIAELADHIEDILMAEIENLTDEEVEALLASLD